MRAEKVPESELHDLSPESEQLNGINAFPGSCPSYRPFQWTQCLGAAGPS